MATKPMFTIASSQSFNHKRDRSTTFLSLSSDLNLRSIDLHSNLYRSFCFFDSSILSLSSLMLSSSFFMLSFNSSSVPRIPDLDLELSRGEACDPEIGHGDGAISAWARDEQVFGSPLALVRNGVMEDFLRSSRSPR